MSISHCLHLFLCCLMCYFFGRLFVEEAFCPMDGLEVLIDIHEVIIKNKKKKSSSKFFKRLLSFLNNRKHYHMLWYTDNKRKFQVRMVNKKSPKWTKNDISLFKDLDFLYERDKHKKNYDEMCKVRFKANMAKLNNYVKEVVSEKFGTCIKITTYEILEFLSDTEIGGDKCTKNLVRNYNKKRKQDSCNSPATSDEISEVPFHYLCVSQNSNWKKVETNMNGSRDNNLIEENSNTLSSLIEKNPDLLSLWTSSVESRDPFLPSAIGNEDILEANQDISMDINESDILNFSNFLNTEDNLGSNPAEPSNFPQNRESLSESKDSEPNGHFFLQGVLQELPESFIEM